MRPAADAFHFDPEMAPNVDRQGRAHPPDVTGPRESDSRRWPGLAEGQVAPLADD